MVGLCVKIKDFFVNPNNERILIGILVFIFLLLCGTHYFSQRPLWYDEGAVLENMTTLNFSELFSVLKKSQAFPRIHLIYIKFFAQNFDYHVLSLRIFSLDFMLAAFMVWILLYRSRASHLGIFYLSVLSFVCSYQMSYYAAELKPYAADVFVVGLYALFFQFQKRFESEKPTAMLIFASLTLPLFIFFSYAGLFVFWIVSYNFLLLLKKNKTLLPPLILNVLMCVVCFILLYNIDLKYSVYHPTLQDYWSDYFINVRAFLPFMATFTEGLREIVTWWFGPSKIFVQAATPFIVIFLYSLVRFGWKALKENRFKVFSIESLFCFLLAELLVLSMCGKYPFSGARLTLFLAPFVFYFIVKGIDSMTKPKFLGVFFKMYYVGFLLVCAGTGFLHYVNLY